MLDLDIEISVVDSGAGKISIELPADLAARIQSLAERYNICCVCSWEIAPHEPCNCGQPGGLRYVAAPWG